MRVVEGVCHLFLPIDRDPLCIFLARHCCAAFLEISATGSEVVSLRFNKIIMRTPGVDQANCVAVILKMVLPALGLIPSAVPLLIDKRLIDKRSPAALCSATDEHISIFHAQPTRFERGMIPDQPSPSRTLQQTCECLPSSTINRPTTRLCYRQTCHGNRRRL